MVDTSGRQTSLWAATEPIAPDTDALHALKHIEVLITDDGFTGCYAALHLTKNYVGTIVLDRAQVDFGGSGQNIGLVNAGLWLSPSVVVSRLQKPYAERTLGGLGTAPELVRDVANEYDISCDISRGVMKAAHSRAAMKDVTNLVDEWQQRGQSVDLMTTEQMSAALASRGEEGMFDNRTFTIQPPAFARGLAAAAIAEGAVIHTSSWGVALEKHSTQWGARNAEGDVTADKVIVCTGAYSSGLIPGMEQSFVAAGCVEIATRPLSVKEMETVLPGQAAFFDSRPAMHFARYDRTNRLIARTSGWLPPDCETMQWTRKFLKPYLPQLGSIEFDFAWPGNIDFTDDHLPWVSRPEQGLYAIGGFMGRGIGPRTFWSKALRNGSADCRPKRCPCL